MLRPRTHARILRFISVSSPVLSGRTRTTVPSLTWRRSGQREPQLTMHADETVLSTSRRPVPLGTSVPESSVWEYCTLEFEHPTRPTLAPAIADHCRNERRDGPDAVLTAFTATPLSH